MSKYFGYSKEDLNGASLYAPTVQPSPGDIIKMLSTSGALVSGEYYQVTMYHPSYDGYFLVDRFGYSSAVTGEPFLVFRNERDTIWSLVNLSGVVKAIAQGPTNIQAVIQGIGQGPTDIGLAFSSIEQGPTNIELLRLVETGPIDIQLVDIIETGPENIELLRLVETGPVDIQLVDIIEKGPENISFEILPHTGPQEVSLVKIIANGPEKVEVKLLPYTGPDSIESVLLPYTGPIALSVIDTRALPVEELSNAPVIPDKGKSNLLNCPPENGPTSIALNLDPIGVVGYYPLYKTEELANLNSPLGTHHTHFLDFKLYYMPNGLEKVWHGDWVAPVNPEKGPTKISFHEVVKGRTKTPKYISHMYDSRASALTGPFTYADITTITSRDNTSEVYAVDSDHNVIMSKLNDIKDTEFKYPGYRIHTHEKFDLESEKGFIGSEKGSFMYRGKFLKTPFANAVRTEGEIEDPLYFKDCYLAIAETNWMHLGSEAAAKQLYRVDLTFAESSLGHVWLYAMNESHKVSGQYKGEIRDNMKVFTNLRGKRFKIKLFVATHEKYPWSMREMSLGYNIGSNF